MKRILVVDDEPTICEVVADTLRDAGYRVETALNGAEALRLMDHNSPPHAIVLDVMMPGLDAHGLVGLMRLNPRLASIPILLVTASYAAHEAAAQLGAGAYLTKPFELDQLVESVRRLAGDPVPLPGPTGAVHTPIVPLPGPTGALHTSIVAEA